MFAVFKIAAVCIEYVSKNLPIITPIYLVYFWGKTLNVDGKKIIQKNQKKPEKKA